MNNQNYTRRKFLRTVGAGSLSAITGSAFLLSGCNSQPKEAGEVISKKSLNTISLQLYTLRNQLNEDIRGTLQKVADIGYKYVETYDFSEDLSFDEVGKMIRDAGLSVSSMHSDIPLGEAGEKAVRRAEAYQNDKVIWHGWPEDKRYETEDGIKELADVYNEANQFLKSNGLQFGLHNHWWEMRVDENGSYPFEKMVKNIDEDIFFEIDTYWVKTAGKDPAEIIKKYGDRVKFTHIKDGPAKWSDDLGTRPHDPMVAVGKGSQDFNEITEAFGNDPTWMVVELDECATDIFEAIGDSFNYLQSNGLAKAE